MTDGTGSEGPRPDTLTETERAHVTQFLKRTRDDFLTAVEPLSPDQWAFQPGPDRWSIGLIAEHLGLVELRLFGRESLKFHTLDHHRSAFGTLNAHHWLLYIPLHHQRHLDQIDEVKAAPGFPPADVV